VEPRTRAEGFRIQADKLVLCGLVLLLLACLVVAKPLRADGGDPDNEVRLTLSPNHPIRGDLSGFANLGYYYNPDKGYSKYYLGWPGLIYAVMPWLQLWGGLDNFYTDNRDTADVLELRPFAGVKVFVPNRAKINLYNLTRYEYRMSENVDSGDWTYVNRIRSRFGVEIPFTSREEAWKEKTFYGIANVEPYYRCDKDMIDPLCARGGVAYVLNDRIRIELIYQAKLTRKDKNSPLEHTENIFSLNTRIGMSQGILQRIREGESD